MTEENVDSIMRRTAVCRFKSSFVDMAKLPDMEDREKLAAAHGIFPRDPTLKDFLRDKPACLVTLRCIWNYARRKTAEECRDVLEQYVVHGGDEGLTRSSVRRSCGLTVEETVTKDPIQEILTSLAEKKKEQDQDRTAQQKEDDACVQQICTWLLQERKDWFTVAQLKVAKNKYVFDFNKQTAQTYIQRLAKAGKLIGTSAVLPKVGQCEVYLPMISFETPLEEAVPQTFDENLFFPEKYDVSNMQRRLAPGSSRNLNLKILTQLYRKRHQPEGTGKKRGAPRRRVDAETDDAQLAQNLAQTLDRENSIFAKVARALDASQREQSHACESLVFQQEYYYPQKTRCRRYTTGTVGAQGISRLARAICFPDTLDYDIVASMFNIVVQLVDLVKPKGVELPSWRAVVADRANTCRQELDCSEATGKHVLIEVACGAVVTKFSHLGDRAVRFLNALSDESRQLRWLACSQMQKEYNELRQHSRNTWPEASIFSSWWTSAEDYILQYMIEEVQQHGVHGHLSCHFDGLLLGREMVETIQCKTGKTMDVLLQDAVMRQTPFRIRLKEKVVQTLDAQLARSMTQITSWTGLGVHTDLLAAVPNSIPAAMVFLGVDLEVVVARLRMETPANTRAHARRIRQYSDWHGCDGVYLLPTRRCTTDMSMNFLLHMELPEESFCMGVKVGDGNTIAVMRNGKVYEGTRSALVELIDAYVGTKETFCFQTKADDPELDETESSFLDLLAGSSAVGSSRKRPAAATEDLGPRNEGEVVVGIELRNLLQAEVEASMEKMKQDAGKGFGVSVCPLCPWRQFDRRNSLIQHLRKHHTEVKRFCASGTKQLRIVSALYDHDVLHGRVLQPTFLARSSRILRDTIKGPMPRDCINVDKLLRCIIHSDGPEFVRLADVRKSKTLRRVGNLYYDRQFAVAFLHAAAAGHGSLSKIQMHFLEGCRRNNGELASLLPRGQADFWKNVMEDLTHSPLIQSHAKHLLHECEQHTEFKYISIDATFKINLKILGQASFHSSESARSAAIIPEEDAAYRTFTCRGRTGATLALCGIRSEKARFVAEVLTRDFTTSQRQQVIHVASDAPSSELFVVLKEVLPNLRSLSLDAMHIVMIYDQNTNNKRTTGSKWLSVIMNKFRKVQPTRTAASWGAFFDGSQVPTATPDVRAMRLRLDDPDMSEEASRRFLENINPDEPWLTEVDFLEALVAHASFFWNDLQKTTYSGVTLHRLIANVASAVKFQYLLNDTRYRHSVDRRELTLLPSGTTSNESLHHELNTWFRETAACLHSQNIALRSLLSVIRIRTKRTKAHIHKSAFHLKLRLFHFLKLLLHNQALYKPMQQQVTQSALVHRALQGRKNVILPAAAWKTWCSGLTGAGVVPKKATLQVAKQAADVRSALKAKKQQEPSASSRSVKGKKRMPTLPKAKATRRAPFRLRVLNPVIRPDRRYRDV